MKKNELKKLISKIFIKHKLSKNHATICAEALVNAELVGAPSHGLSRLKMYCDRINKGVINPRPKIKIKKITQSITQIDAKNSIGFVAADIGIKKAIESALINQMLTDGPILEKFEKMFAKFSYMSSKFV